jgi:sulfhydrogenase subunit beta (sulfur reductase)
LVEGGVTVHIKVTDFHDFLHQCRENQQQGYTKIFIPVLNSDSGDSRLDLLQSDSEIILDHYRAQDPAKILFYRFREAVSGERYMNEKQIIAGLKACDFEAIKLLDSALITNDFFDPAYKHWRDNTLLITCDCNALKDSCHCSLVAGKPYVEKGFDINLIRVNDFYHIQTGTEKGKSFINLISDDKIKFETVKETETEITKQRNKITELLALQNADYMRSDDFFKLKGTTLENWTIESNTCIGCAACTNICPTCYCLILNDESKKNDFIKVRSYDSCQLHGYARVAGGASPRPKMTERFRNRYLCKFCYMQSNFQSLGCTGCGRCIDACPAGIDFRQVVKNIEDTRRDHLNKTEKSHA